MNKSPEQVFMDYLKDNKLSMTPQRKVIVETFLETEGHFSAEELSRLVKERVSDVGQATVYRTLKLLVESGLADTVDLGDGVSLYEHAYQHEHHDHMICINCGKKVELSDDVIEEQQKRVARDHGFKLTHHRMYLYGLCDECRKKLQ